MLSIVVSLSLSSSSSSTASRAQMHPRAHAVGTAVLLVVVIDLISSSPQSARRATRTGDVPSRLSSVASHYPLAANCCSFSRLGFCVCLLVTKNQARAERWLWDSVVAPMHTDAIRSNDKECGGWCIGGIVSFCLSRVSTNHERCSLIALLFIICIS